VIPLVYHPGYNITAFGLERLHPFDSRKYQRIHDALIARGLRRPGDFRRPSSVRRRDLLNHADGIEGILTRFDRK
jgi:histone deacetylase 11